MQACVLAKCVSVAIWIGTYPTFKGFDENEWIKHLINVYLRSI